MKNIYFFYIAVFAPLLLLMLIFSNQLLPGWLSVSLLLVYVLVYRSFIDGLRLFSKGLINKKEIWKISFSGSRAKFFKKLYLKH